jgi:hypothetical protein
MRRIVIGALALAGLAAGAGSASADTWSAAYTGTIVATYADGHSVKVYVEPDHSFSIVPASGPTLKGNWQDSGSQSCFTITEPASAAGGSPTCLPVKDYQSGDTFDGTDGVGAFHAVINSGR